MASASLFSGSLARTWQYATPKLTNVINLYHDTITGTRSCMLNYEEIPDSLGSSSLMMSAPHRINFKIEGKSGYVEIRKSGFMGFSYICQIDDQIIAESTQIVAQQQHEDVFHSRIVCSELTSDDTALHSVVWYLVETRRLKDDCVTAVHRRFRDFADLNDQVKQNLKGNHLYSSIPPFPEKTLKIGNNKLHSDPAFIQARLAKLEIYVAALVRVPHVVNMICMRAFFGLMESVREFSVIYRLPQLGVTLQRSANETASVCKIQNPEIAPSLRVGDSVSKVNGVVVSEMNFNGIIARIRRLPRPMVMHFIQVISFPGDLNPTLKAAAIFHEDDIPPKMKGVDAGVYEYEEF